jgi:hypothetical protein
VVSCDARSRGRVDPASNVVIREDRLRCGSLFEIQRPTKRGNECHNSHNSISAPNTRHQLLGNHVAEDSVFAQCLLNDDPWKLLPFASA